MGMIDTALALVFGDGSNVVRDTVEVFRANAEKTATAQPPKRIETRKKKTRKETE